jgi:5-methylcytosine-specific restriction endonuclease McrA
MRRSNYLPASGESWQKARMRALVRDDFTCQAHQIGVCDEPCGEDRLHKLVVHHIKYRINGGTHDLDNLITVCHKHHADIHPHLRFQLPTVEQEIEGERWLKEIKL